MSRRETEFNMNISQKDADSMHRQGRASQEKHGQGPASKSLDQVKLPGAKEEEMMEKAGKGSQMPAKKRARGCFGIGDTASSYFGYVPKWCRILILHHISLAWSRLSSLSGIFELALSHLNSTQLLRREFSNPS